MTLQEFDVTTSDVVLFPKTTEKMLSSAPWAVQNRNPWDDVIPSHMMVVSSLEMTSMGRMISGTVCGA